jgi:hypothetical protein
MEVEFECVNEEGIGRDERTKWFGNIISDLEHTD